VTFSRDRLKFLPRLNDDEKRDETSLFINSRNGEGE
jgi:hypothetical protein